MPIDLYPSIAKVKRNNVFQNLPGFVPETGDDSAQAMIANAETSTTAQYNHPKDSYFILNNTLYQADEDISINDAIAVGTNCHVDTLGNGVYKNTKNVNNLRSSITGVFDDNEIDNIASTFTYTNKKAIKVSNGSLSNVNVTSVTNYVPVVAGTVVEINSDISSTTYGHGLYSENKTYISGIFANSENRSFVIPEGVSYIRFTVLTTAIPTLVVNFIDQITYYFKTVMPKEITQKANPYQTYTIKDPSKALDGFTHCAFPTAVLFAGKEVVAFRASMSHLTPTDPSNWGGIMIWTRSPDGTWENKGIVDISNLGINGEFRDARASVSRDGQTLFLSGFTCYRTQEAPTTDIYDCVIVTLNTSFQVTGAFVETNSNYLFWGNILETPEGHLISASYYNDTVKIHRSTAPFNGDISQITFDTPITIDTDGTEPTIGYWNNMLVLLNRRGSSSYSAHIAYTENLEGNSGWQEPQIPTGGLVLHAPVLLPYWKGDKLPFAAAWYQSSSLRYPVFGLISYNSSTHTFAYSAYEQAANISQYSGYCGLVYFGGCDFGLAYYLESAASHGTVGAQTGLYYKHFNARTLLPQMAYMQDPNIS